VTPDRVVVRVVVLGGLTSYITAVGTFPLRMVCRCVNAGDARSDQFQTPGGFEGGDAVGGVEIEAVAHHQEVFARPPALVTADRGVHSADTEEKLRAAGVKQVAIPAVGKASEERRAWKRTRTFRRGYRWRAGIEGRIASLRRDFGWRKTRYHGEIGMERWLGLGVIASNLRRIALAQPR
jgi:hypothetical protein